MIEAMGIARFAAEDYECWAQSFVSARPEREVAGARNATVALSGSKPKASGSAGGYLLLAKERVENSSVLSNLEICSPLVCEVQKANTSATSFRAGTFRQRLTR
jgi:hypothetical protein